MEARFTSIQAGHHHWRCAQGRFRDRIDTNPPKVLPFPWSFRWIQSAALRTSPIPTRSGPTSWVRQAGTSVPALQAKASGLLKQQFAPLKTFSDQRAQKGLPLTHARPRPRRVRNIQDKDHLKYAMMAVTSGCLRQYRQPAVGARHEPRGAFHPLALGAQRSRIVRQLSAESVLLSGMGRSPRHLLSRSARAAGARLSDRTNMGYCFAFAAGHRLCIWL